MNMTELAIDFEKSTEGFNKDLAVKKQQFMEQFFSKLKEQNEELLKSVKKVEGIKVVAFEIEEAADPDGDPDYEIISKGGIIAQTDVGEILLYVELEGEYNANDMLEEDDFFKGQKGKFTWNSDQWKPLEKVAMTIIEMVEKEYINNSPTFMRDDQNFNF